MRSFHVVLSVPFVFFSELGASSLVTLLLAAAVILFISIPFLPLSVLTEVFLEDVVFSVVIGATVLVTFYKNIQFPLLFINT